MSKSTHSFKLHKLAFFTLTYFGVVWGGVAFSAQVATGVNNTITGENSTTMGENLINTSRQSSLYGENSTLTGNNISKEELNNLISTQSDKIQARNNKQQELDRTATNISTNQLNQDTIRRRIELLKEANREATRKNEALQNLTNQKTSKEHELETLRQALESAKAEATNQTTHTDRTVWSNFENQLRSLNWDKLTESNGVDQLANELKAKVENDFPTITKYDVEKYKPLINGYVNSKGIFGKNKEKVKNDLSNWGGDSIINTLIEENKHQGKLINQLNDFFPKKDDDSEKYGYYRYYITDESYSLNNPTRSGWEDKSDLRAYLFSLLGDKKATDIISKFYKLNNTINSEEGVRHYQEYYKNLSSNESINQLIAILDKHKLYTEERYSYDSGNGIISGSIKHYNISNVYPSSKVDLLNDLKQLITKTNLTTGNNQAIIQKYLTYNKFSKNQEVMNFIGKYIAQSSDIGHFNDIFSFQEANTVKKRDLYSQALEANQSGKPSAYYDLDEEYNLIRGDASSMVVNLLNAPLLKDDRKVSKFMLEMVQLNPDELIKTLKESDVVEAGTISSLESNVNRFKLLNSLVNWDADQSQWTINKADYKQKFTQLEQYFNKIEDYITSYRKATQDPSNKEKNAEMLKKYHDLINGESDFLKKQKITETTLSQKGQELLEKFNRIASESNDRAVVEMNDMIDKLKLFDRNHQIVREVNEKVAELTNNIQSKEREIAEKQAELNNINTSISNNALTEEERNANTLREEKERELAEKQREKEQLEQEKATKERELEELNRAIQSGNLTNKGLQNIGIGYNNFNSGSKAITIGNENTVLADGAIAIGNNNNLSKEATNTFVLGSNVTTNIPNSVALGKDTTLSAPIATPSHTIAGTQYNFAGIAPVGTVSIGAEGKERTLTHLAAGRISNTSTDGINGSQLNTVIETLNGLSTELTTLKNAPKVKAPVIKAGDGLSLTEGDDGSITLSNALTFNSGNGMNVNKDGNNITITNTQPLSVEDKTKYDTASTNASSALEKANTNEGSINTANGKINDLTSRVTANEGNITTLTGKVTTVTNTANEALGKANTAVQPDKLKAGDGISVSKGENGDITITNTHPLSDENKTKYDNASAKAETALQPESLVAGNGVTVNNAGGKVTITNTGVIEIQAGDGVGVQNNHGVVTVSNTKPDLGFEGKDGITVDKQGNNVVISATGLAPKGTGVNNVEGANGISVTKEGDKFIITNTKPFEDTDKETLNTASGKANTAVQPDKLKSGNGISINKAENSDITVTNTKPFDDADKEKLNNASTNANSALEKAKANEGAITTANGKITANEEKITAQEGKVNDLTSRVTANEGNITTLTGNVTTVTNTANEALEKANQALKPTDLVAGKGIQVTQSEDGRMKIASNLVAGEGIDLSESNGSTVVKSLIDIQAGKGINVNKNGNVFTISSVGNAIPKLEITGDDRVIHEVAGALSVVGDENIETHTQGGKVNVKLKKNIQVDSLKVGDNLLTQGGLKIGNAIITDKGSNMGNQVIDGVANGEIAPNSQQVINGSQIYEITRHFGENMNNLQQQISSQNERMEQLNRENQAGIANVVAMANLPQATLPGRSMISAAVGTHKNARAVSVGVSRLSDNQKLSIKFSASTSVSKGKATVSAGAGVGLHF